MKVYSFYHGQSGLFHGSVLVTSDEGALWANTPAGYAPIEGTHNSECRRVDVAATEANRADLNRQLNELLTTFPHASYDHCQCCPADTLNAPRQTYRALRSTIAAPHKMVDYQPPQPSADHEWTGTRWQISEAARERNLRRESAANAIAALEASQHRPLRELARDPSNITARSRLEAIDLEIATLRSSIV